MTVACTSCLPSLQLALGAGTQVSGGFGGFGSAAVPGGDATGQMPVGGGGAAGWGEGGGAPGGRSMARLSATQLDSLRRDAGLPSVKSLSSDQSVRIRTSETGPIARAMCVQLTLLAHCRAALSFVFAANAL